jgi:antitoxin component YwqK of YwqJK toxin-antitoxin module
MIRLITFILISILSFCDCAIACHSYFYAINCDPKSEVIDVEIRKDFFCENKPEFIKKRVSHKAQKNDSSPKEFYLSSDGDGIADFRFLSGKLVRIKAGMHKIPRPYGENGAEQGYKISIWINKAKVLSAVPAVKVVLDRKQVKYWENTKCKVKSGWVNGECGGSIDIWENSSKNVSHIPFTKVKSYYELQEKYFNETLVAVAVDEKEYPINAQGKISDNRIVILHGKQNPICKRLLRKGSSQDSIEIPEQWNLKQLLFVNYEDFIIQDIDNNGEKEILFLYDHFSRTQYGSDLYVFDKKMQSKLLDYLKTIQNKHLSTNIPQSRKDSEAMLQDLLKNAKHQYPKDWARNNDNIKTSVGHDIEFNPEFTFLKLFIHNKSTYVLLHEDELSVANKFMVIKPEEQNCYKEICVFKKIEPNF